MDHVRMCQIIIQQKTREQHFKFNKFVKQDFREIEALLTMPFLNGAQYGGTESRRVFMLDGPRDITREEERTTIDEYVKFRKSQMKL